MPGGLVFPRHEHRGFEHAVVLSGGYEDERGEFVAGDYSIADMAAHPWINPYTKAPLDLSEFANVRRWHEAVAGRPAVQRAYALADRYGAKREMTPEMHKILFGTPANSNA